MTYIPHVEHNDSTDKRWKREGSLVLGNKHDDSERNEMGCDNRSGLPGTVVTHKSLDPPQFFLICTIMTGTYAYVRTAGPASSTGKVEYVTQRVTGTKMTECSYPPYIGTDQPWRMGPKSVI
jgi:hypothetical protein